MYVGGSSSRGYTGNTGSSRRNGRFRYGFSTWSLGGTTAGWAAIVDRLITACGPMRLAACAYWPLSTALDLMVDLVIRLFAQIGDSIRCGDQPSSSGKMCRPQRHVCEFGRSQSHCRPGHAGTWQCTTGSQLDSGDKMMETDGSCADGSVRRMKIGNRPSTKCLFRTHTPYAAALSGSAHPPRSGLKHQYCGRTLL
jgi:hypothetical protein